MNNSCPKPGCDAIYNLNAQHAGRQFACRKCGTMLFVDTDGLRYADPGALRLPDDAPAVEQVAVASAGLQRPATPQGSAPAAAIPASRPDGVLPRPTPSGPSRFPSAVDGSLNTIRADLSSWMFGLGAFLVIFFLFLPIIDQLAVVKDQAKIAAGDTVQARRDLELSQRDAGGKPDSPERKQRKTEQDQWAKDKALMQLNLEDTKATMGKWGYWYTWGMMLGFILLSVAAIGYLSPRQAMIRRIVGAIILCAQMLLIFYAYVNGSVVAILSRMGH